MVNERDNSIRTEAAIATLLKKKMSLPRKTVNYIKKYQITYKKVIIRIMEKRK
jgi:hypothetical protein